MQDTSKSSRPLETEMNALKILLPTQQNMLANKIFNQTYCMQRGYACLCLHYDSGLVRGSGQAAVFYIVCIFLYMYTYVCV